MKVETEQRLVDFLDAVERERQANGDKLGKIQTSLDANSAALDELAGEVSEIRGNVIAQSARLGVIETRLESVEDSADRAVEATGRHDVQRVQDQLTMAQAELRRRRERSRHWVRYAVGAVVTLVSATGLALLGYVLGSGP